MAGKTLAKKPSPKASPAPVAAMSVMAQPKPTKEDKDRERRWRAEDALRVLTEAEKHKADSALMKDVAKLAAEKVAMMSKVASGDKKK